MIILLYLLLNIAWFSKAVGLKLNTRHFSTGQSTGHDTDKGIALKVSPSPSLLTKYSIRSRGICVVW